MSQFSLEAEIQSALRLDSSINVQKSSIHRPGGRATGGGSVLNVSGKQFNASGLNRSRSESRLHTALFGGGGGIAANANNSLRQQRRSGSRGRTGSLLDLSSTGGNSAGSSKSPGRMCSDRFIPNRSTTDMEFAQHSLSRSGDEMKNGSSNSSSNMTNGENGASNGVNSITAQLRRQHMADIVFGDNSEKSAAVGNPGGGARILSFKSKAPAADEGHMNNLKVLYSTGKPKAPLAANTRQVSSKPEKILDAPDLIDDFYLHLIDWSSTNHLAVALHDSVFIWNANDGSINELFSPEEADQDENVVCCVSWVEEGSYLAVSSATGSVDLWDAAESKMLRRMGGHEQRVAALAWNQHNLASGCFNGSVHLHDVRIPEHHTHTLNGHSQEVCGLAWAPNDGNYLATGANDNLVLIYDKRNYSAPCQTLNQHQSAIKAMSWCPWHSNTLATGGGSSDRSIKFWNASTGNLLQSVDVGSQVSSLLWNAEYRELVSGHGFSHNQLTVWKYPNMTKVADLKGHSSRILLAVKSPDGSTIASASADETIRLWKVWPPMAKEKKKATKETSSMLAKRVIR